MNYNYETPRFLPEDIANFFNCYVVFKRDNKTFWLVKDKHNWSPQSYYNEADINNIALSSMVNHRVLYKYYNYNFRNVYYYNSDYLYVSPTYKENTVPQFHIGDEVFFCSHQDMLFLTKGRVVDISILKDEDIQYGDDKEYLVESTDDSWCCPKGTREWVRYHEMTKDPITLPEVPSEDYGVLTPIKRTPQEIADFFGLCVYASNENNNTFKQSILQERGKGSDYCYMMINPYYFTEKNVKTNFPRINHEDEGIMFWSHEKRKKDLWNYEKEYNIVLSPLCVDFADVKDKKNGLLYLPKYLREDDTYRKVMKNRLEFVKSYKE